MAIERNPNESYQPDRLNDPLSPDPSPRERRAPSRLEEDLQADPELAEGHASNARIALFAIGIAIVLGAVFYGLNNTPVHQQDAAKTPTPATAQNAAPTSPPAAPPGIRDVTPRSSNAGTTTGNAPASPQTNSPASTQPGGANTNTANPGNAPVSR